MNRRFPPPNNRQHLDLGEHSLESGEVLPSVRVAYETYGELNVRRDNAILACHALTGDSHLAPHCAGDEPGWWDDMVGPGRALDTNRYQVICSNVLGGCYGTTGPSSTHPATGRPYGSDFPAVSIRDMVQVQYRLVKELGIRSLVTVTGGSMGGMQALEWALTYPDLVRSIIPMAACGRLSAQGIALNRVQRLAIMSDPDWQEGHYYDSAGPVSGLGLARMIGIITYKSEGLLAQQFGRRPQGDIQGRPPFDQSFSVESYLDYQGQKLVNRFDANTYLYLSRAMDLHDVARGRGGYEETLERIVCPVLSVGISSDYLFPPYQQQEMVQILGRAGREAQYCELESLCGHDAFLVEQEALNLVIQEFLPSLNSEETGGLAGSRKASG